MTVEELIKELGGFPRRAVVVLSIDPEGNAFHFADGLSEGHLDARGEYQEEGDGDGRDAAVCLWPA
jgi:hypothetical protein